MDEANSIPICESAAPPRRAFVAWHMAAWCLAAPLLGMAAARAAVWAERIRAPWIIFPLLVGCGLGFVLAGLLRLAHIGHRPTLLAGALLAGAIAALGQHYFDYRDYLDARAAFISQREADVPLAAFGDPLPQSTPSFAEYMRRQAGMGRPLAAGYTLRGAAVWASWAVDGLLLLAAAASVVWLFSRGPYCNRCHSWYRAVRSGTVRGPAVARLAATARLPAGEAAVMRYRLSSCAGGCGPGRLELAWDDPDGHARHGQTWLAAGDRENVARTIDEAGPR